MFGRFRLNRFYFCVLLCWQFTMFFTAQMLFAIFANYIPRWRCLNGTNSSLADFGKDCQEFSSCPPESVQFEPTPFHSTAMDFRWICGDGAYKRTLYSQAHFFGVLLGTILFGSLSDAFGRKPISILGLLFGIGMMVASATTHSWLLLLATRFLVGLSIGVKVTVFTFVNELILPEQRMFLRAFFNWGNARLGLTLVCLLFPHWQPASIVSALFCLPALLLIIFVFPESPTWLGSKNKLEQKTKSEKWIARFAGKPFVAKNDAEGKEEDSKKVPAKSKTFRELIREKELFRRVLVLWFMWFTAAISSYTTDLNSSSLSGDFYLNQFLLSLLTSMSKLSLLFADTYFAGFSRRKLHQGAQLAVILCFLTLTTLILLKHMGIGILLANLLGIVFIELTWDACYLCAVESVPTQLRATTTGSCSLVARFGALLSPIFVLLNGFWSGTAYLMVAALGSLNLLVSYNWLTVKTGVSLDAVDLKEDEAERKESRHQLEAKGPSSSKKLLEVD